MSRTVFVRLVYNPSTGHLRHRYMLGREEGEAGLGKLFRADKGWYKVVLTERQIDKLRSVRSRDNDPTSPFAFNICDTVEEAEELVRIEEEAKKRAETRPATPSEAHELRERRPSSADPERKAREAAAAALKAAALEAQRAATAAVAVEQAGGTLTTADLKAEQEAVPMPRHEPPRLDPGSVRSRSRSSRRGG